VIVDALGNLIRFVLLPGQRHDITSFDALMAGIYCLALIGDKGFDARWLRERLRANDMEAVIPLREGTSGYAEHDREKYKYTRSFRSLWPARGASLRARLAIGEAVASAVEVQRSCSG
jgi:hypothetical protein